MLKKLLGGQVRTKVIYNTVSQFAGRSLGTLSTFLISIILARSLGVTGFGDFTKITSFTAIFYLLSDFGINAIFIKKSPDSDDSHTSRLYLSLLVMRLVMSLILIFILLSIVVFLPSQGDNGYPAYIKLGIIFYSITILTQSVLTTANAAFQKKLRYDQATIATTISGFLMLLLVFVSSKIFLPRAMLYAAVGSLAVGSLVSAIVSVVLSLRLIPVKNLRPDLFLVKNLFISSLPFGLTLLCNAIYFRIDQIILTLTRPTYEVGIYGLAYKMFEFPLVIPTFFMNSVYPFLVGSVNAQKDNNLKYLLKRSFIILSILSVGITITVFIIAPYVTLIKPEFSDSTLPLRILSLSLPFFFISSLIMWGLLAMDKKWQLFGIYLGSMLINLVLNIIFIPRFGFIAASWITVASEALVVVITGWALIKEMRKKL